MGQAAELLSQIQLDDAENFTQETIERFKSDPASYRRFVKGVEKEVNSTFQIVSTRSIASPNRPVPNHRDRLLLKAPYRPSHVPKSQST